MNFLSNFFALYNSLPEDDVFSVAMNALIANRDRLAEATIYDMAELCAVSRTTLNRLTKRLGYGSFKEFRYDMTRAFSKYDLHNRLLPLRVDADAAQLRNDITAAVEASCRKAEENLSPAIIEAVISDIHAAKTVNFYLDGTTGARTLQTNLIMDGKKSRIIPLYTDRIDDAARLKSGDMVVIADVETPDSLDPAPIYRCCAERGVTVLLLGGQRSRVRPDVLCHYLNVMSGGGVVSLYGTDIALAIISRIYRQKYMDGHLD